LHVYTVYPCQSHIRMLSLLFGKPVALEALKWKLHSFHLWLPWQTLVCTHHLVLTQTLRLPLT